MEWSEAYQEWVLGKILRLFFFFQACDNSKLIVCIVNIYNTKFLLESNIFNYLARSVRWKYFEFMSWRILNVYLSFTLTPRNKKTLFCLSIHIYTLVSRASTMIFNIYVCFHNTHIWINKLLLKNMKIYSTPKSNKNLHKYLFSNEYEKQMLQILQNVHTSRSLKANIIMIFRFNSANDIFTAQYID